MSRGTSLRITEEFEQDLNVLLSVAPDGKTMADVIRESVRIMADGYRTAWDYGMVPENEAPRITGVRIAADAA